MYNSWRKVHTGITRTGGGFVVPAVGGGGGGTDIGNGWTEWAHTSAGSANTISVTTPAIDTSNADLIIAVVAFYNATAGADFSDSKSNSWSVGGQYNGGAGPSCVVAYYSRPTAVGSGHTFTFQHGASATYCSMVVYAVSGSIASPLDAATNGNGSAGATSQATGSITPTQNNELVISALCAGAAEGSVPSINSSMVLVDRQAYSGGTFLGINMARITQGTAAAINPTWSWTNSIEESAGVWSFKHS